MKHQHRLGIMAVIIALAVVTFTWPAGRLAPRGVPVGVVGTPPPTLARSGAYELHRYASSRTAERAIRHRDVYGAFAGSTTYVATGASPAVALTLRETAPGNRVVDLAPGTRHDPRIATVAVLTLPIALLGIFSAAFSTLTTRDVRDRLLALGGGSVLAGLIASLTTHTWLQAIPGTWLGLAGVVALAVFAIGTFVAGLAARFGPRGIGVGAVVIVLVGNAWSGASAAPDLLPQPAHAIGQLSPTGAVGQAMRSVGWFAGAGATQAWVVLGAWAVAGATLLTAFAPRRRAIGRAAAAAPATPAQHMAPGDALPTYRDRPGTRLGPPSRAPSDRRSF